MSRKVRIRIMFHQIAQNNTYLFHIFWRKYTRLDDFIYVLSPHDVVSFGQNDFELLL